MAFFRGMPRNREVVAWVCVILQIACLSQSSFFSSSNDLSEDEGRKPIEMSHHRFLQMNKHQNNYYENRRMYAVPSTPYYESPQVYPKEAGLVSRVWRSNGSPMINADLQMGSCWCSADEWCMCTPSLAIDVILRSGEKHLWLVQRQDTGLLALMGGFTEVGETSEESVHRELKEEMGISLESPPVLFGVYNDPRRDARRHTTSVVYIADVPADVIPQPGDDATNVVRLDFGQIENHKFFVDHKTIIHDYVTMIKRKRSSITGAQPPRMPGPGDGAPFKRSVCPM
eukprot:CAMPEP_0197257270 /NCGR_PEP_ID=MMETSP1429-20130617/78132_1 /TAXON_ID=49237 /ORGANISM="Chaetoceros  sp., Strain UNC1202" /LENGTH=284 /DNA_ID=CAMNT_0042721065 /DNA_START=46 /DNA_END=900 /DNA_ORIENTATION=+